MHFDFAVFKGLLTCILKMASNEIAIIVTGDDRHGFRSLSTYPIGLTSLKYDLFWVNEHSKRLYWAEKNTSTNYNKKITLGEFNLFSILQVIYLFTVLFMYYVVLISWLIIFFTIL